MLPQFPPFSQDQHLEAVKLAEKKGFRTLKGFVNGVLRNIARNVDSIQYPDKNTNIVK